MPGAVRSLLYFVIVRLVGVLTRSGSGGVQKTAGSSDGRLWLWSPRKPSSGRSGACLEDGYERTFQRRSKNEAPEDRAHLPVLAGSPDHRGFRPRGRVGPADTRRA